MKDKDIVGLGACGIDYYTNVNQFSNKENKVTSNNLKYNEGGVTANNLVQAARLGLNVLWTGNLGAGKQSDYLIQKFKENNIEVKANRIGKTQFCWIIVNDEGEKQIYIFPNSTAELTPEIVEEQFKEEIKSAKHFHTEVAVIPLNVAIKGAEIAKEAGVKVLVDVDGDINYLLNVAKIGTKEELNKLIKLADVIKLSESAAKQISGDKEIKEIVKGFNKEIVAVTLGSKGCIIANQDEIIEIPAVKINCVDSTGAGDAFMGGLSYAILKEYSLKEIGEFANACGAYCCQFPGTRTSGSLNEIGELK